MRLPARLRSSSTAPLSKRSRTKRRRSTWTDARLLDPEIELGDDLGEKIQDIADLGRIAAQSAKQVIIHRMRDAERDVIYDMFRDRQGTIVNGIVQRFERGNMIVNLGRTDAVLPSDGQIPKRSFKQGDRIRAYLLEVRQESRDSQLILSRTCNEFLSKLFELEVPEIAEGIVKIMGVAREPGFRAKIAVSSTESDVDPVGRLRRPQGVPGAECGPGTAGRADRYRPLEPGSGQVRLQRPGPGRGFHGDRGRGQPSASGGGPR